jgi:2-oxoglutarate ferredoxin oxidoreductase subunit beta
VTKSTPDGSVDNPFKPLVLALGAEATFIARSIDVEAKHLQETIRRAHAHRGTSFVEILQNCNIFNDGAFADVTEREIKADHQLVLEDGKPMIFGRNRDRGIRMNGMRPEVVSLADVSESDLLMHDEKNPVLAYLLGHMTPPEFPTPIGVLFDVERPVYEAAVHQQLEGAKRGGDGDLVRLLGQGDVWTVS